MNNDFETPLRSLIAFCQDCCDDNITKARKAARARLWVAAGFSFLWLVPMCVNFYLLHYWMAGLDYSVASSMAVFQWWNASGTVDLHRKFKKEWAARKAAQMKLLEYYREHKWE